MTKMIKVRKSIKLAKAKKLRKLTSIASSKNIKALKKLASKFTFKLEGVLKDHYRENEDAYIYSLFFKIFSLKAICNSICDTRSFSLFNLTVIEIKSKQVQIRQFPA